ncbi:NAD(P)H-binding protein [Mucilaginibacter myungsuensis]|uniref:NAD(P)H-binding protein n=1 Tax=Mucilaginibacter myungsuensis TaxID=649104 RepID=A0A929PVT0_9SPHI|nr:NAD(P)H-binding protein [Mucilaginibacter myungsuensis]MBE9660412.1 NAD(P)H-binding protein [Mucilaginibacter myungsuensis]MDN3600454.1 NAD(P)H-binding protein [Mucilaginibacter myungsuensis]
MTNDITISVLGCGWFGKALAVDLINKGHLVKGSTTSLAKLDDLRQNGIQPYLIDLQNNNIQADFFDCDIIIVACGANIGDLDKYCKQYNVKRLIFISTTGVYDGKGEVDERSRTNTDKPHYIAEQRLASLPGLSVIRFAGLVGPGRLPGRFLAGKKDLPAGSAPVNLIHLEDCIGLTEAVIARPEIKLINGVSPDHPTRVAFYRSAAEHEGLTPPQFNDAGGEQKLVHSYFAEIYQYQINDWLTWINKGY